MSDTCPTCGAPGYSGPCPPEPPVGTWMKDRYGAATLHQEGGGWGPPGMMALGVWERMWEARGPYTPCGPWGAELDAT